MRDYKYVAQRVLERRDAYLLARKRKRQLIWKCAVIPVCLCFCIAGSIGYLHYNDSFSDSDTSILEQDTTNRSDRTGHTRETNDCPDRTDTDSTNNEGIATDMTEPGYPDMTTPAGTESQKHSEDRNTPAATEKAGTHTTYTESVSKQGGIVQIVQQPGVKYYPAGVEAVGTQEMPSTTWTETDTQHSVTAYTETTTRNTELESPTTTCTDGWATDVSMTEVKTTTEKEIPATESKEPEMTKPANSEITTPSSSIPHVQETDAFSTGDEGGAGYTSAVGTSPVLPPTESTTKPVEYPVCTTEPAASCNDYRVTVETTVFTQSQMSGAVQEVIPDTFTTHYTSLEQLFQDATAVIRCNLLSVAYAIRDNTPYTIWDVQVTDTLSGAFCAGDLLSVVQPGGYLPADSSASSTGMESLVYQHTAYAERPVVAGDYVLFLSPDDLFGGAYVTLHANEGIYRYQQDTGMFVRCAEQGEEIASLWYRTIQMAASGNSGS